MQFTDLQQRAEKLGYSLEVVTPEDGEERVSLWYRLDSGEGDGIQDVVDIIEAHAVIAGLELLENKATP